MGGTVKWHSQGYFLAQLFVNIMISSGFPLYLLLSPSVRSLEEICLQVTDLLPNLKKLRGLLPEHGCLLLSPGNFWQNDRERFNNDPDIIKTIHQHEPKTLQTSATPKGRRPSATEGGLGTELAVEVLTASGHNWKEMKLAHLSALCRFVSNSSIFIISSRICF